MKKAKMNSLAKKKVKSFFLVVLVFVIPVATLIVINIKPASQIIQDAVSGYLGAEDMDEVKRHLVESTLRYQNDDGSVSYTHLTLPTN